MDELFRQAVYLRMGERLALTAVIVFLAIVVCAGFWKSLQRIEFQSEKAGGIGGVAVLTTPVFVLLTLVGYAWVTLNAPVSFSPTVTTAPTTTPDQTAALTTSSADFTAVVVPRSDDEIALDRHRVQEQIRHLNCLRRTAERSVTMSKQAEDNFVDAKLDLLSPVWDDAWGNFFDLADWARGFSDVVPIHLEATAFEQVHPTCPL